MPDASANKRLTDAQALVLRLTAERRLEWVRPVLSGGGYLAFPVCGNSPKTRINRRTVRALVDKGLIEHPASRHDNLMRLTSRGRSLLRVRDERF